MNTQDVYIKKLTPEAVIPEYKTEGSAGFDFYSSSKDKIVVQPGDTQVIKTGLAMQIPLGYEIQVRPRSGKSLKTSLRIANSPGTLDSDYRGEIGIIAQNTGEHTICIYHHERIAQGVLSKVPQAKFIEVEELDDTQRGSGGFGSTGV